MACKSFRSRTVRATGLLVLYAASVLGQIPAFSRSLAEHSVENVVAPSVAPASTQSAKLGPAFVLMTSKASKTCTSDGKGSVLLHECGTPDVNNYPSQLDEMPDIADAFTNLYCSTISKSIASTARTIQSYINGYCEHQGMRIFNPTYGRSYHTANMSDGNTIILEMDFVFKDGNSNVDLSPSACLAGFSYPVATCKDAEKEYMSGGRVQATLQDQQVTFWVSIHRSVTPMSIPPRHVRRAEFLGSSMSTTIVTDISYSSPMNTRLTAATTFSSCSDAPCALIQSWTSCTDALCVLERARTIGWNSTLLTVPTKPSSGAGVPVSIGYLADHTATMPGVVYVTNTPPGWAPPSTVTSTTFITSLPSTTSSPRSTVYITTTADPSTSTLRSTS